VISKTVHIGQFFHKIAKFVYYKLLVYISNYIYNKEMRIG
jgi:hypothetical protein